MRVATVLCGLDVDMPPPHWMLQAIAATDTARHGIVDGRVVSLS
jgi:hypothetical protein